MPALAELEADQVVADLVESAKPSARSSELRWSEAGEAEWITVIRARIGVRPTDQSRCRIREFTIPRAVAFRSIIESRVPDSRDNIVAIWRSEMTKGPVNHRALCSSCHRRFEVTSAVARGAPDRRVAR